MYITYILYIYKYYLYVGPVSFSDIPPIYPRSDQAANSSSGWWQKVPTCNPEQIRAALVGPQPI